MNLWELRSLYQRLYWGVQLDHILEDKDGKELFGIIESYLAQIKRERGDTSAAGVDTYPDFEVPAELIEQFKPIYERQRARFMAELNKALPTWNNIEKASKARPKR